MNRRTPTRGCVILPALAWLACASIAAAAERPSVAAADARITFTAPTRCVASLRYRLDGPAGTAVEHRLLLYDGTDVGLLRVTGATASTPAAIGRSLAVLITTPATAATYDLSYDVRQSDAWPFRCPLWLPTVPTREGPGRVRLEIEIPPDATAAGSQFPLFAWEGPHGKAVIGDVPAFVRAPFSMPGYHLAWPARVGSGRVIDALAVGLLGAASAAWVFWRRR